jgi:hypothetical protein
MRLITMPYKRSQIYTYDFCYVFCMVYCVNSGVGYYVISLGHHVIILGVN